MRASVERLLPAWSDHPARGYLHGCHAFTLEETGAYAEAEAAGHPRPRPRPRRRLGAARGRPCPRHDGAGARRARLACAAPAAWEHCNNFRYHVWWHMALMHIDLGETDAALALYDAEVRRDRTDDYRDIANATSLLARLELEGVDVGARWEELADLAEVRSGEGSVVFADLHYALALIGGSREAALDTLISRMRREAARADSEMDAIAGHPGLAAARASPPSAAATTAPPSPAWSARDQLQSIGGSHAQRDVFERLTIEAALRSGALAAARIPARRPRPAPGRARRLHPAPPRADPPRRAPPPLGRSAGRGSAIRASTSSAGWRCSSS
jgi:hypothetical protein